MAKLLTGSLAKTINKAMGVLFLDATLTRDVQGQSNDIFDPVAPTQVTYSCKAIHEDYSEFYRAQGFVNEGDRKVLILAQSLAVQPQQGDRITLRDQVFLISNVSTDPALAVWTCKAAGIGAETPTVDYSPSLDFSISQNSMYSGQVV